MIGGVKAAMPGEYGTSQLSRMGLAARRAARIIPTCEGDLLDVSTSIFCVPPFGGRFKCGRAARYQQSSECGFSNSYIQQAIHLNAVLHCRRHWTFRKPGKMYHYEGWHVVPHTRYIHSYRH